MVAGGIERVVKHKKSDAPSPQNSQSPGQSSAAIHIPGQSPPTITASDNTQATMPTITRVYRMQHRELPDASSLGVFQSMGLQVVLDVPSRVALFRGQADTVLSAVKLLESVDLVQDSCAVQTWAVFVDRTATRGFDLVSALATASGAPVLNVMEGGFTLNVGPEKIALALSLIADGSSVEVVQRPHVRLTHGATATIESIQEVPVPTTAVSQGISQTSIDYRKVGLQLSVTPHFLSRDRVRLGVSQTNGLLGQNVVIAGNNVPIISSQTVQTAVEMTVGQTVVLGGVSTQRTRQTKGILRNSVEVAEGALYVILSTYDETPKAVPVGAPPIESPDGIVPLSLPIEPSNDWLDGNVLPPLHTRSGHK